VVWPTRRGRWLIEKIEKGGERGVVLLVKAGAAFTRGDEESSSSSGESPGIKKQKKQVTPVFAPLGVRTILDTWY